MRSLPIYLALSWLAAGCGKEIGDACIVNSDCSTSGDRICVDPTVESGYCSIMGCDYSTCPDEAVCVKFFTGSFTNRTCESQPCSRMRVRSRHS